MIQDSSSTHLQRTIHCGYASIMQISKQHTKKKIHIFWTRNGVQCNRTGNSLMPAALFFIGINSSQLMNCCWSGLESNCNPSVEISCYICNGIPSALLCSLCCQMLLERLSYKFFIMFLTQVPWRAQRPGGCQKMHHSLQDTQLFICSCM